MRVESCHRGDTGRPAIGWAVQITYKKTAFTTVAVAPESKEGVRDYRRAQSTIAIGRTEGEIEQARVRNKELLLDFVPGSGLKDGAEQVRAATGPGDIAVGLALITTELPGLKQAKAATKGAQSLGSALNRSISFSEKQLQKKFGSHASDFGITRTWGKGAAEEFQGALNAHVADSGTRAIFGTYRGTQDVTHFFNPQTGLNVMRDANGAFLSGWKLSTDQVKNLLSHGNIQ